MRMVKRLIGLIVILLIAAFAYPLLAQGTWSECDALEKQVFDLIVSDAQAAGKGAGVLELIPPDLSADGRMAAAYVRRKHPDVPPVVGCTYAYWRNVAKGGLAVDREAFLSQLLPLDLLKGSDE